MNPAEALALEHGMWEAARNRDAERFLQLVSPEAIMVCGGFRCTGREYSEIIRAFDCKCYRIENFETVHETDDSVQVHYVLSMEVEREENRDLAGTFHITTTWKRTDGSWKVIFNMDQRVN